MDSVNKLYLFNLCEKIDISARTIFRLYNGLDDDNYSETSIKSILGDTNTAKKIIESLPLISTDHISLFALYIFDINLNIIEILRKNYSSLIDLYTQNEDSLKKLGLQEKTQEKIHNFFSMDAIQKIIAPLIKKDEAKLILNELSILNCTIKINDFYNLIGKKYGFSDIKTFNNVINKLLNDKKIKITGNGISLKKEKLETYISNHMNEREIEILNLYLNGKTLEEIAAIYGVSKQRIDQILDKRIAKLPEFENEKKVFETLSLYKFSKETIGELYVAEPIIPYYVITKYKPNASKNEIDYVIENNLIDTPEGIKILKRNKYVFIKDQLYKVNFSSLFEKYLEDNNLVSITPEEHEDLFRQYLKQFNINLEEEILKGVSFESKIKHTPYLLPYGKKNFYWFIENRYDEAFISKAREYLENFYGYGCVDYFYNNNTKLCNNNGINNAAQLFIVLKTLFEKDYIEDIEFIRNPAISTKGLDKEQFLIELLENYQPIKYDIFITMLEKDYGIKKPTFIANYFHLIKKYKGENGILSTNVVPIDENDPSVKIIREYLNNKTIVPLKQFQDYISKEIGKQQAITFTSKHYIKRLGYKVTNYAVFNSKYNSVFEAMNNLCDSFNYSIPQNELKKYYPIQQLDNRYDSIKQNCLLLRFTDSSFLNIKKVIDREMLIRFRDELIDLLPDNEVFTLQELNTFLPYKQLLNKYNKIDDLIKSLNTDILISLIQSSPDITFYENDMFVFGKGKKMSPKQIIKIIINREECMEQFELIDLLSSSYGIDIGSQGASFFAELGFFYSSINNTIYKSKQLFNKQLSIYLDSMEENEDVE